MSVGTCGGSGCLSFIIPYLKTPSYDYLVLEDSDNIAATLRNQSGKDQERWKKEVRKESRFSQCTPNVQVEMEVCHYHFQEMSTYLRVLHVYLQF